jgi:hypothetical protein
MVQLSRGMHVQKITSHFLILRFFIVLSLVLTIALWLYWDIGCLFLRTTGIPCPECGMTSAWRSALHMDFLSAFQHHPMFWSVPLLFVYLLFDGIPILSKKVNRFLLITILLGWAIAYFLKLFQYFQI